MLNIFTIKIKNKIIITIIITLPTEITQQNPNMSFYYLVLPKTTLLSRKIEKVAGT
jgi:hypothetical protein